MIFRSQSFHGFACGQSSNSADGLAVVFGAGLMESQSESFGDHSHHALRLASSATDGFPSLEAGAAWREATFRWLINPRRPEAASWTKRPEITMVTPRSRSKTNAPTMRIVTASVHQERPGTVRKAEKFILVSVVKPEIHPGRVAMPVATDRFGTSTCYVLALTRRSAASTFGR